MTEPAGRLPRAADAKGGCCSPQGAPPQSRPVSAPPVGAPPVGTPLIARRASDALRESVQATLVDLRGGFFDMGARHSPHPADLDGPPRRVAVSPFRIARTAVTNRLFADFVAEAGYATTAEREGWSFVFHLFLPDARRHTLAPAGTPWWRRVEGADWAHPEGPGSDVTDRADHPVVHVSWHDAQAFCAFTGTRLPHEAEWECAARGGRRQGRYPWGNDPLLAGQHRHNVWQGVFPFTNTAEDGYAGTAPVTAYRPNDFGLFNMTGNVWEWCEDGFGPLPSGTAHPPRDPLGPDTGQGRVMRGGSYLCDASYCERYYVHSRSANPPDASTGNIGFRLAG